MTTADFFLIKCLPDLRRREPRNVGVVLRGPDGWAWRFVGQDAPNGTEVTNRRGLRSLNLTTASWRAWIDYLVGKASADAWQDVLDLRSGRPRNVYVEPGGTLIDAVDLTAAVERLFDELVGEPAIGGDSISDRLSAAVERILDESQIHPDREVAVSAKWGRHLVSEARFDFGYQNGQLHLMERVNVGTNSSVATAREVWARMRATRDAGSAKSFIVFWDSTVRESSDAEEAISIVEEQASAVDVADAQAAQNLRSIVYG